MASEIRAARVESRSSTVLTFRRSDLRHCSKWWGAIIESRLLPASLPRWLPLVVMLALLPACGITFGSPSSGTELFKHLELDGDLFAQRRLVLSVEVSTNYPVPVRVACYYEAPNRLSPDERKLAFHNRATVIGERVLEPVVADDASSDEIRRTLRFAFVVRRPGEYFAACLTPAAPENGIGINFEVKSAIDAVA